MNERLELSGIRDAAMQPPVGGAAGYEQMLLGQFQQAAQDEENLRREAVRAATQRALDRSGWYNIGSMLVPQDAGEAVLGLAMGPGLGRGLRTALAALGGMTTQPGDAEGAFLPRSWFERMSRHTANGVRQEGMRGQEAIRAAERASGINDVALRADFADPDRANFMFPDMLEAGAPYGALPTEAGWVAALNPQRRVRLDEFIRANADSIDNPHAGLQDEFVGDLYWQAARPEPNRGTFVGFNPYMSSRGSYFPVQGEIQLAPNADPLDVYRTYSHEQQHWVQGHTPDRRLRGSSHSRAQNADRALWDEYVQRFSRSQDEGVPGWTQVSGGLDQSGAEMWATRALYAQNFGEWEARLADKLGGITGYANQNGHILNDPTSWFRDTFPRVLEDFNVDNALPDFRIR